MKDFDITMCLSTFLMNKAFSGEFAVCYFILFLGLFGSVFAPEKPSTDEQKHVVDDKWR